MLFTGTTIEVLDALMIFELAKYATAITAISAVFIVIVKYAVVIPIKTYIDFKTYQIQPESNGGKSLSDLHNKVAEIRILLDQHLKDHRNN